MEDNMSDSAQFIDRDQLGEAQNISIPDFVSLKIDYRSVGDKPSQMKKLTTDYESVGYRSILDGTRQAVDTAMHRYMRLITYEYNQ